MSSGCTWVRTIRNRNFLTSHIKRRSSPNQRVIELPIGKSPAFAQVPRGIKSGLKSNPNGLYRQRWELAKARQTLYKGRHLCNKSLWWEPIEKAGAGFYSAHSKNATGSSEPSLRSPVQWAKFSSHHSCGTLSRGRRPASGPAMVIGKGTTMIRIDSLTKKFGQFTAVNGLSFTVAPGEVLGFLGPNGAGKSTTMKMITGFLAPTSGQVSIMGHDVAHHPVKAKQLIGYLPEGAPSYGDMTV